MYTLRTKKSTFSYTIFLQNKTIPTWRFPLAAAARKHRAHEPRFCFQPTTALTAFGLQQLWLPSAYNRFIRAYLILEYKKSPAVPGAAA
ncbi:MAG: hypothetical protein ACLUFV_11715 [Acutalibacteraceae bacterium]